MIVTRLPKLADDPVALGRGGVDRHQIVVVEVDPPRTRFAQQLGDLTRRQTRTHRVTEGVAAAVADGPQTERELVLRTWCKRVVGHGDLGTGIG